MADQFLNQAGLSRFWEKVRAYHDADAGLLFHTQTHGPETAVSFDGKIDGYPLKSCLVRIEAVRAGSGTPLPTNIRPISGWNGCRISVSGGDSGDPTVYPVSWQTEAGTVYGGTVDLVSGALTMTHGCVTFDGTEAWNTQGPNMIFWRTLDSLGPAAKGNGGVFSHLPYGYITGNNTNTGARVGVNNGSTRIYLRYAGMPSTVADWKAELAQWYADGTPFQAVYEMATPLTYQLTPQAITALAGENQIRADTGDVTVEYGAFLQGIWEEIGKIREEGKGNRE